MSELNRDDVPFLMFPTDIAYRGRPEIGPDCLCSRCERPILRGVPIRAWDRDDYEYRYHPACLGFVITERDA